MAFDMKKLAEIAKPRNEIAKEKARFRKENRAWLRMSQEIAMCLHYYLRNNGMTQKEMADKMGGSPVYVNKLLKGEENLTLEEEPVSNDLEEAAWAYYDKNKPLMPYELDLHKELISFFIAGAQWQKQQDQSTIELAEDHAYLAGQEKIIAKACEWFADNYSKYIITNGLSTIFSATIDFDTIRMIEDFKKAMEE